VFEVGKAVPVYLRHSSVAYDSYGNRRTTLSLHFCCNDLIDRVRARCKRRCRDYDSETKG
jgi:hypothetical protein